MKTIVCALLAIAALSASAELGYQNAPATQGEYKIGQVETICKQTNRYLGWPTVICRKNGELIAVFSGDRDAHICPYGKVQMIRSKDFGKTWSAAETIINSPLDDRDAGILELENGNLVLFWFNSVAYQAPSILKKNPAYKKSFTETTEEERKAYGGSYCAISASDGRKWSFPIKTCGVSPHGGALLKNGDVMLVCKGRGGSDEISKSLGIEVGLSTDGCKSWKVIAEIKIPEGDRIEDYWEPHVVEAANGDLIAQIRCHKDSYVRQSVSKDCGKTWTVAEKIDVVGFPSHLLKLKDGNLLMTYSRRAVNPKKADYKESDKIMGQYARFSYDNGKTWGKEIMLCRSFTGDMGYPSTAQLPDGSFYTVFYHNFDKTPDNHKPKEAGIGIFGVRWSR